MLLSPTPEKLGDLRDAWEKTVKEAEMKPGDRAEAEKRWEENQGEISRGGDRTTFGGDQSEANGSSIAVILEYGEERWLLAGDAHEDVLVAGLARYAAEQGESHVRLDGFKIPHHGSTRNMSVELLEAIDCKRFLVSTSGAYFKHPDEACIDLIIAHSENPEIVFNYRTEFTDKWADADGVTAIYPEQSEPESEERGGAALPSMQEMLGEWTPPLGAHPAQAEQAPMNTFLRSTSA